MSESADVNLFSLSEPPDTPVTEPSDIVDESGADIEDNSGDTHTLDADEGLSDAPDTDIDYAEKMRTETAAVRIQRRALVNTRTLTPSQKLQAANTFDADGELISASKRILDMKNEHLQSCARIIRRATSLWKSMTVPYPEAKIRLIPRRNIDEFESAMRSLKDELSAAINTANVHYAEMIDTAEAMLGSLFNRNDYPVTLDGVFDFDWDFPSVEPPNYLQELHPAIFRQEQANVAAQFQEAVSLTEAAFASEFEAIVNGIVSRLTPQYVDIWHATPATRQVLDRLDTELDDAEIAVVEVEEQQTLPDLSASEDTDEQHVSPELRDARELVDLTMKQHSNAARLSDSTQIEVRTINHNQGHYVSVITKPPKGGKRLSKRFEDPADAEEWLQDFRCQFTETTTEEKTIRNASVDNLTKFFDRFASLNIGSHAELDSLVDRAKQTIKGVTPEKLRNNEGVNRDAIRNNLSEVLGQLEPMLVDRPARKVVLE